MPALLYKLESPSKSEGSPLLEECAERASPHRRQLASWMSFYKTNDRILSEKLHTADVWIVRRAKMHSLGALV